MKKFAKIAPCELTVNNMDRYCALFNCPSCNHDFSNFKYCFQAVKIVAICEAPFVGGIKKDRPLALVYECPNCFGYFWFHTTESHKSSLENLLNGGDIKC